MNNTVETSSRKVRGVNVLSSLPVWANVLVFIGCAAEIWIAGTYLSSSTEVLSDRLHLG